MIKILKSKNIYRKFVNNQNTEIYHKISSLKHIVSKEWEKIYSELIPVYEELEKDFQAVDVVDLIFYERWLNE